MRIVGVAGRARSRAGRAGRAAHLPLRTLQTSVDAVGEVVDRGRELVVEVRADARGGELPDDHREAREDDQRQAGRAAAPAASGSRCALKHAARTPRRGSCAAAAPRRRTRACAAGWRRRPRSCSWSRTGRSPRPPRAAAGAGTTMRSLRIRYSSSSNSRWVRSIVALAAADLVGVGVQREVADDERGAAARRAAAQQRAQAGEQLLALEGLDEVVVGARRRGPRRAPRARRAR